MGSFSINQTGPKDIRPPLSFKVREYFESFIEENILTPKKIIIHDTWNICLTLTFFKQGRFGPAGVHVYSPTIVKGDKLKAYPIQIPIQEIADSNQPMVKIVELFYEGLTLFFTGNYKQVDAQFMQSLWNKIDMEYLLSLPYPAKIKEQRYLY
ncbi:hypothetical protein [Chitinophaga sp. Cy-1792]|uniref:hypothetical protein n=1 Tax=Chitinophaga sp. Cy-1792 TaxID=2608339 RepID=UPI0014231DCD|nr:hypothetical protein [Chitinophaga sp. Cy-1792]NIG55812.1 hypothetical protein [Chitinophaga sp. Cy-1792]